MLKIQAITGEFHIICHLHQTDVPVLRSLQARFNGELALASANHKSWIRLADLDLDTAKETEVVIDEVWQPRR